MAFSSLMMPLTPYASSLSAQELAAMKAASPPCVRTTIPTNEPAPTPAVSIVSISSSTSSTSSASTAPSPSSSSSLESNRTPTASGEADDEWILMDEGDDSVPATSRPTGVKDALQTLSKLILQGKCDVEGCEAVGDLCRCYLYVERPRSLQRVGERASLLTPSRADAARTCVPLIEPL